MAWGPIVVGVDDSPAAVGAAALAERIAKLAAVGCELVHAVRDAWAPLVAVNPDPRVAEMQLLQQAVARDRVRQVLKGTVSDRVLDTLKVRFGPAAVVLRQVVEESRPGLLVLGGKHHTALERWLGGSTSLHVVRTSEVPVLITAREPATPRRILVAADLSNAAGPTVRLAERFADLTEPKVATASTSVPPAVASDEIVAQSAIPSRMAGAHVRRPRPAHVRVGRSAHVPTGTGI